MRESNYTFPPSNRAVISINQMLYDRRALDTNSTLALLNNLCQLTYLTSTSPRIREVLTMDGGLERMLDILRESSLPREQTLADLWGLNGPSTARTINVDRAVSLRHSLAFQCVVNIGVRGNENIRTRVVQAGALDIVAQILESWLKKNGISIFSSALGSQAAVDAAAAGIPLPGVARSRRQGQSRHHHSRTEQQQQPTAPAAPATAPQQPAPVVEAQPVNATPVQQPRSHALQGEDTVTQGAGQADVRTPLSAPAVPSAVTPAAPTTVPAPRTPVPIPQATTRGLGHFVSTFTNRLQNRNGNGAQPAAAAAPPAMDTRPVPTPSSGMDTDVEMADAETEGGETDANDTDNGGEGSMDVEYLGDVNGDAGPGQTTTPRARLPLLPLQPLQIPRRSPDPASEQPSTGASSAAETSGDEPNPIPRARSDVSLNLNNQATIAPGRPRSGFAARVPHVAAAPDAASTQSSPVGSPVHTVEHIEGTRGRRGTVVGRPLLLAPRDTRRQDESEASDGAPETDLAQATITAGIAAAAANAAMEAAANVPNAPRNGPQPAIVEGNAAGMVPEEPDPEILAAEQARFDMEAGAPPGQPGAAQTPQVTTTEVPLQPPADLAQAPAGPPAQIIIANGAPRGFQDLASYVGVSMLLNPEGTNYSEDNILVALQLLAYLSKYPHVRAAFHHPRRPMHRTFELGADDSEAQLPERPAISETPNIFSLVERFTFRPSPSDPHMYRIPSEIQYWAGVIMRNACRKDDAQGGIRQCAYMSCGRWEVYPREFAKCRRCRKAKYCSKECQSKAWSEGHRFCVRSEPEPNADGSRGGGGGGAGGGGGGGGGGRADPRRTDGDDDVNMGNGSNAGGGGTEQGGVNSTPRATRQAAGAPEGDGEAMDEDATPASGETTPRPQSRVLPVPRGAAAPSGLWRVPPRSPTSSNYAPPLPPTATPPPPPTFTPATPVAFTSHASVSSPSGGIHRSPFADRPDFLKRDAGQPGPSSTAAMNAAMRG